MNLKIAVWQNLPSGGGKRALYSHVKGLIERGHYVEIWCPSTSDQDYLPLRDLAKEHVIPFSWKARALHGRIRGIFTKYQDAMGKMQAMSALCQQCADEIHQNEFDLLFANSCAFYAAPFITRFVQLPRILYLQEPYRPFYEASPTFPWVAAPTRKDWSRRFRFYKWLQEVVQTRAVSLQAREEWLNASACDQILVNSYYSRETIRRVYGLNATVCYLGIDTSLFRDLRENREDWVIGVGSVFPNKGLDLALKSLAFVPQPRPKLFWIGNSVDRDYMSRMIDQARCEGTELEILLRVSDQDLVSLLNRAKLYLHTASLEPFGFAPLEANACATPVVAIKEGGVRETIEDGVNGLLVDGDPQVIADAIQRIRQDANLARQMGTRAKDKIAQEWSMEGSVDRLEMHLQNAAQGRKKEQNG